MKPTNNGATKQDIHVLDKKIEVVDSKVQTLDKKVQILDEKVQTLDKKVDTLDKRVEVLDGKVETLDNKIDTVRDELKEDARKNKDEIMNTLVAIVGELQTIREEQILSVGQYRNHENRIIHLEKLQGVH